MTAAIVGAAVLAVLVQIVEFMCTSGFPALFTRILTLRELPPASYYGYMLLYNAAYMLDDIVVLSIGVVMLSRHRLQEKEGRVLKLISGVVMVGPRDLPDRRRLTPDGPQAHAGAHGRDARRCILVYFGCAQCADRIATAGGAMTLATRAALVHR